MKLRTIELKGFQNHTSTVLHLHEGLNTIVGHTDAGKSSIVRAIRWVVFNRPGGDEFIKKDRCVVRLVFDSGIEVKRIKSKSKNTYVLTYKGKKKVFKAFGRKVPEEISKSLNMSETNFQNQLDPPFFVSEKPGRRGELINSITKMDQATVAIKTINQIISQDNLRIKVNEEDTSLLQQEIEKYEWARDAEKRIEKLKSIQTKIQKTYNKFLKKKEEVQTYSSIQSQIEEINAHIEKEKNLIAKGKDAINPLLEIIKEQKETSKRIKQLSPLIKAFDIMNEKIKDEENKVQRYERKLNNLMKGRCPLCNNTFQTQ